MKYLITGCAGFLGTNLTKKILKNGHKVIGIDNLYSGNQDNVDLFKNNNNYEFIEHNITEKINLKVDGIFNLACPASPVAYQNDPFLTLDTCYNGTLNILKLAEKNKAKILHTSTSEIYGNPLVHPQKENYFGNVNTFGPRACYDEGKRVAETLVYNFKEKFNLNIRIVRIFNTYGPHMSKDDGRVISNFTNQALLNKDITVYGNGQQTRSFCYVDDLISGIIKFYNQNRYMKPVNLGNNRENKIEKIAKLIIQLTKSKSKIVFKNKPIDDPVKRKPNLNKIKKIINWEPKVELEDGLIKTINYFKKI